MDGAWPAIRFTPLTQEAHAYPVQGIHVALQGQYCAMVFNTELRRIPETCLRPKKKARWGRKWGPVSIQKMTHHEWRISAGFHKLGKGARAECVKTFAGGGGGLYIECLSWVGFKCGCSKKLKKLTIFIYKFVNHSSLS